MCRAQKLICDDRGMVLFTSLLILSLLVVAGLGARVMLQSDFKILANLRGGTEAFYVAEAGIEWSKVEVNGSMAHPPNPTNRTQSFSSGTFSVAFISPIEVTSLISRIVVRSTGIIGTSTQTIQAQLTKTYDLADGAIGLRGNASRVGFSGNTFFVSGVDHDPANGEAISESKPRTAISVSDTAIQELVEDALRNTPAGHITAGEGDTSTVAQTSFVPGQLVARLGDELCGATHALTTFIPSEGMLSLTDQSWGSRSSPQLRCIEGLAGPGDSVNLGGNLSGVGILVVKNAELVINGSFRWEGLVIVSGSSVGFRVVGEESKEIYGSLMVNENGTPLATGILDIGGAIRVLFSRPALGRAATTIPSSTLQNAYSFLPSTVTQNYWKTINP